jgi:hypothetical protein
MSGVKCPYCGEAQDLPNETYYDGDEHECYCEKCKKPFDAISHVVITFSTVKRSIEEEEEVAK